MSPPRAGSEQNVKPHGQIRQSQIVTTFGPGAMVDLPDHAVIIGGLDHWTGWRDHPIHEERLAAKVKRFSAWRRSSSTRLRRTRTIRTRLSGITAWLFPEWFIAQYEVKNKDTGVRSRPLVPRADLEKGSTC